MQYTVLYALWGHYKGVPISQKRETNTDNINIFNEGNLFISVYNAIYYRHMKISYATNNGLICHSWIIKENTDGFALFTQK